MAEYEISYLLQKRALFKVGTESQPFSGTVLGHLGIRQGQGQLAVSVRGGGPAVAEREGCQDQSSR